MSRSYKKHPVIKQPNKGAKKLANRKVRAVMKQDLSKEYQNSDYKKIYPQYDIHDWKFRTTLHEYLNRNSSNLYLQKSTKEAINSWNKFYKRK